MTLMVHNSSDERIDSRLHNNNRDTIDEDSSSSFGELHHKGAATTAGIASQVPATAATTKATPVATETTMAPSTNGATLGSTKGNASPEKVLVGRATITPDPPQQVNSFSSSGLKKPPPMSLPPLEQVDSSPFASVPLSTAAAAAEHAPAAAPCHTAASSQEDADFLLAKSLQDEEMQAAAAAIDDSVWVVAELEPFYRPILAILWPEVYNNNDEESKQPPHNNDEDTKQPPAAAAAAATAKSSPTMQDVMPPPPDVEEMVRLDKQCRAREVDGPTDTTNPLANISPLEFRAMLFIGGVLPFLKYLDQMGLEHDDWEDLACLAEDDLTVLEFWDSPHRAMLLKFICKYLELFGQEALLEVLANNKNRGGTAFEEIAATVMQYLQENGSQSDLKMPATKAGDNNQLHADDQDPDLAAAIALSLADAAGGSTNGTNIDDEKTPPKEPSLGEKRKASVALAETSTESL